MSDETKTAASPRPWKVERFVVNERGDEVGSWERGNVAVRCRIVDGDGVVVATLGPGGIDDAKRIVLAVNEHEGLVTMAEELTGLVHDHCYHDAIHWEDCGRNPCVETRAILARIDAAREGGR